MTFFVKCNNCGRVQEGIETKTEYIANPINPDTKEKWYSRTINNKTEHACNELCLKKGMVWPKWALP